MAAATTVGLGDPLVDPPGAKVDIIFVRGIRSDQANEQSSTTAWPPSSLTQNCGNARVSNFTYQYTLNDFYPESHHTGCDIDTHSKNLLDSLEARTKHGAAGRSIIFVARDLAGLVCANALSHDGVVVSNTRGLVFIDTPFEGNALKWTKVAKELPVFQGLNIPSNLKERSSKLIEVHKKLLEYLGTKREDPLAIRYFCENSDIFTPSTLYSSDALEEISDESYEIVAQVLREWVDELSKTPPKSQGSATAAILIITKRFTTFLEWSQGALQALLLMESISEARLW
ncbi:hypothetical protein CLIM01_11473 [Colletotrichum limetticola]|uniref:Uncharacterized protein n=1 Tax=Colletotrichum limetticola TaxID=1209924 RepID=A0ABQ9PJ10_9PEZI|nr:hypothetical protein CLIM01_11473 [Colletotrichum limetticola]